MGFSFQQIKDKLAEKGLKTTHQRMVVFQALASHEGHPTAEEVYEKVKIDNPSISLGTIYKTLETFVEKELILKVSLPGGRMRYDMNMGNHGHIYCSVSKEIYDYFDEELIGMIEDYINKKKIQNFNINGIRLHIRGEKIDPNKKIEIQ